MATSNSSRTTLRFKGVDTVSHLAFPRGYTFPYGNGSTGRLYGVSAVTVDEGGRLLALCDRGYLLRGDVKVHPTRHSLESLDWRARQPVLLDGGLHVDAEGMALLKSGELLFASEPHLIGVGRFAAREGQAGIYVQPLPQALPEHMRAGIVAHDSNLGVESLTLLSDRDRDFVDLGSLSLSTSPLIAVTGVEGSLAQDDDSLRRVLEFDALTGAPRREVVLLIPANDPELLLVELVALDSWGLSGGGQFLALLRGWTEEKGNDIRLLSLNTDKADDVSHCRAILGASFRGTPPLDACWLSELAPVESEELLRWTPELPLMGELPVDNYEAMTLVPSSLFGSSDVGGIMVLLANDDNESPEQIGTQFVLLRLALASDDSSQSLPHTLAEEWLWWPWTPVLVTLVAVFSLVVVPLGFVYRRWQRNSFQRMREEPESAGAAEGSSVVASEAVGASAL